MKLWIDDIRPAPEGYIWVKSVNEAKDIILKNAIYAVPDWFKNCIIDLDHDAGDYVSLGGDYIKLLDWLERTHTSPENLYKIGDIFKYHIHSANPVGVENMRRIIRKNGWSEV